jgi:hypothetical protein
MRFLPGGSITTIQNTNTQVTYTIHISHTHIHTKNKQTEQRNINQRTKLYIEGHITANEYRVGKGKEIKLCLIQALEAY